MSVEQGEKCPLYEEGGYVSEHRKLKLLQNKKPTKILKRCWRAVIPELQGTVGNLPKVSREGLHGCPPEGSPRPHSYAHHRVHCDAVGKWIQLLPLVQSEAILLFQSLHCTEFTWSSACWEAGPASLSAMHKPVSISFPFNPWAWLTLPCGTHKSGVSTPRLRFPMVFQQSQAVLQEEARSGVDKRVLAQPYSILGTGHSTLTEGLRDWQLWWSVVPGSQLLSPWRTWINAKAPSAIPASHLPRRTQQKWPLNVDSHLKKNSRLKIK